MVVFCDRRLPSRRLRLRCVPSTPPRHRAEGVREETEGVREETVRAVAARESVRAEGPPESVRAEEGAPRAEGL